MLYVGLVSDRISPNQAATKVSLFGSLLDDLSQSASWNAPIFLILLQQQWLPQTFVVHTAVYCCSYRIVHTSPYYNSSIMLHACTHTVIHSSVYTSCYRCCVIYMTAVVVVWLLLCRCRTARCIAAVWLLHDTLLLCICCDTVCCLSSRSRYSAALSTGGLHPQDREEKGDRGLPVLGGSRRISRCQRTGTRKGQRGGRWETARYTWSLQVDARLHHQQARGWATSLPSYSSEWIVKHCGYEK